MNLCKCSQTRAGFSVNGAWPVLGIIVTLESFIDCLKICACWVGITLSYIPHIIKVGIPFSPILFRFPIPICVLALFLSEDSKAYLEFGQFILLIKPCTKTSLMTSGFATICSNTFLTFSLVGFIAASRY